jgi:hypothetical protein
MKKHIYRYFSPSSMLIAKGNPLIYAVFERWLPITQYFKPDIFSQLTFNVFFLQLQWLHLCKHNARSGPF